MMFDEGEYYSPSDVFTCINSIPNSRKIKMKMMNKRRFSDEQVKSLESIFENETKLEPKKKVQVARELGLQPRQVAIWFQNKRARYKSKQLEKDYNTLRANYNSLAKRYDELNKEKQSLFTQLQKLREQAEKEQGGASNENESDLSKEEIKSENENNNKKTKNEEKYEEKPALSLEGSEYGACSILSDEGSSENTNYFTMEDETDHILRMVQQPVDHHDSFTSQDQGWDDLHSHSLFDKPLDSFQWCDFWS